MSEQKRKIKTRDWHAVNAWFRRSLKSENKKRELSKQECRKWKQNKEY